MLQNYHYSDWGNSHKEHSQCVAKVEGQGKSCPMEGNQEDLRAIGREIRRHRRRLGLSQEQLAERAGLHRNYVGFLERGERNASLTTLFALARSLNVSLTELFANLPDTKVVSERRAKKQ
jgi:DNA-binding XRE family transcriptional regulator